MSEQSDALKDRTMQFAVAVLRAIDRISRTPCSEVVVRQLAKSATSIGANYRATCNARSRQEFVARLGVVVEEADESSYWLELADRAGIVESRELEPLMRESKELRAIFARSLGTARANLRRPATAHSTQVADTLVRKK